MDEKAAEGISGDMPSGRNIVEETPQKELLCIVCPTGCRIQAARKPDGSIDVRGNSCKRGVQFAIDEMTCPMRSLTTTVRTAFAGVPVLPVRTDGEIPREKVPDAMRALRGVVVDVRLACGDVVLQDVAGCGCRVIATSDILREVP